MGKKKNQKPHQTKSFEQLVGEANRNALKPYIGQVTLDLVNQLGNQLSERMFKQLGNIQTRIMALEKLLQIKLGMTQRELQNLVLDVEDEATGHTQVARPAQTGDLLRVTIKTKNLDETEFQREVKKEIETLAVKPYSVTEKIEQALVGATTGQVLEIPLNDDQGNLQVTVQVTVDRISEAPKAPEQSQLKVVEGNDASPNA